MARTISNKARKTLSSVGVSPSKVARARRREINGFAHDGRTKNRGFTAKKK